MKFTEIKRLSMDVGQDKPASVVCVMALEILTNIKKRKESCLTSGSKVKFVFWKLISWMWIAENIIYLPKQ